MNNNSGSTVEHCSFSLADDIFRNVYTYMDRIEHGTHPVLDIEPDQMDTIKASFYATWSLLLQEVTISNCAGGYGA